MMTFTNDRRHLCPSKTKETMNMLLITPFLADAGMATATSGAIVLVVLSVMAIIRSKMPS